MKQEPNFNTTSGVRAAKAEAPARRTGLISQCLAWSDRHRILSILAVSALAILVNCYPIIFCGRSYVSPVRAMPMVYGGWPSLPGITGDTPQVERHGSDTGATMWWAVPMGFVESRSILDQGELPLWNRYSHAGDTLIGQAVSMMGDPLHLIVLAGHGSALAWDIKFLLAKFLFCAGFGLLIRRLLGHGPLSLVYAALAAWCGAFFFINNHPAFFVFCYSPWILLSALALLEGRSMGWGAAWLLANVGCFNGGHVEVAVAVIGGLNLAALGYALVTNLKQAPRIIGRMAVATTLFMGLTAPVWISFLSQLQGAYSAHADPHVIQFPFRCLPAIFDDFFSTLITRTIPFDALIPETGLLILVGCALSAFGWKLLKDQPFFWVNSAMILCWTGSIFGWIPASFLLAIPLFNRVG
ncbi:MAG TPA: hypothetical protein VN625_07410, partial [Desulfuromonadaceae bacterium]|nr:hypothetical protein [Desulfuromonadaceae bacterium]